MHHEFGPAQGGRERPYLLLVVHSHFHSPLDDLNCLESAYGLPAVVVRLEEGGHPVVGTADRKTMTHCRGENLKRDRHTSRLETALVTFDGPVVDPAEEEEEAPIAGSAVVVAVVVAAAVEEGNKADRLEAGRAQFGKTAQRMMVRLVQ